MDENMNQNAIALRNLLEKFRPLETENENVFTRQKCFSETESFASKRNKFSESAPIRRHHRFRAGFESSNLETFENDIAEDEQPHYLRNIKRFLAYQSYVSCCEVMTIESIHLLLNKDLEDAVQRDNYIFNKHRDILPEYRYLVLDWILEICSIYKFYRETYYLTMAYFDIYISNSPANSIMKEELQLIALSSLMMATKVEEIKALPIEDICFLCDNIYSVEQILHTERSISDVLNWKCYPSTPNLWFLRFIHILDRTITEKEYFLCTRLLDVATFDLNYLKFPSCVLAAGCIKLVMLKDIFPECSGQSVELNVNKCTQWLRKYWQEIYFPDRSVQSESCANNEDGCMKCPRFSHLSFRQTYYSNIKIFEKLRGS